MASAKPASAARCTLRSSSEGAYCSWLAWSPMRPSGIPTRPKQPHPDRALEPRVAAADERGRVAARPCVAGHIVRPPDLDLPRRGQDLVARRTVFGPLEAERDAP